MIIIAHRANLNGPNPMEENTPNAIINCISKGYNVEIDIWLIYNLDKSYSLYLGHDSPDNIITDDFLQYIKNNNDKIICHAKNLAALDFLVKNELHCFFHDIDIAVLTSKNWIWLYPGNYLDNGIIVMPERVDKNLDFLDKYKNCKGICTDYAEKVRNTLSPPSL